MIEYVVDSSVGLAWLFDSNVPPTVASLRPPLKRTPGLPPSLWRYEVANGIRTAVIAGRISQDEAERYASEARQLPIIIDRTDAMGAFGTVLQLSLKYNLSVYDATYLDLAIREELILVSLDGPLNRAAVAAGVRTLLQP